MVFDFVGLNFRLDCLMNTVFFFMSMHSAHEPRRAFTNQMHREQSFHRREHKFVIMFGLLIFLARQVGR